MLENAADKVADAAHGAARRVIGTSSGHGAGWYLAIVQSGRGSARSGARHVERLGSPLRRVQGRGGKGRQRPWRAVSTGFQMTDVHEDPETAMAAGALARVITDRWLERAYAHPRS